MRARPACMGVVLAILAVCAAVGSAQPAPAAVPPAVPPAAPAAPTAPPAAAVQPPNTLGPTLPVSSGGSLDGSKDLKVPILAAAIPRLEQIQAQVMANASAKSGNRSFGQDTERAAAAGYVVRRGTQFFRDGKPFYFVGGNAYWFVDFYTLNWGREKIEEFMDTCQALGISVLRTWFFNLGMPKDFDRYDARQLAGMDYVLWAAKRRGLLLTLTMGNLWNAYRGPEDFLLWATGSLAGKDILDFYSNPQARALYKLHIWGLLSRVNPLTGLAPKDDPTIFSFNIINEPRCPGCFTAVQQAAHQDWLRDVGSFMRSITPLHLISAGTEGFFVRDTQTMLHWYNPGPGAECDGEDWFSISALPYLDYATVHVYERHMELLPVPNAGSPNWPNWEHCGFTCYVPWFRAYNQLHNYLAQNVLKKPVVIEEFGLTWFKMTPPQQRVLFKVAMDMLVASAESGGALAGAMFWNAAHNDTVDWDGYNVKIQRPAYIQAASALPVPTSFPSTLVSPEQAQAMTPDNRTRPIPPDVMFTADNAPPALRAQMQVTRPAATTAPPIVRPAQPAALPGPGGVAAAATPATPAAAGAAAAGANATAAQAAAPPAAAAATAAGLPPSAAAAVAAAAQQPSVPQVPATSAAGTSAAPPGAAALAQPVTGTTPTPVATQPVATAPQVVTTAPATAVGRRLLSRLPADSTQQWSLLQQPQPDASSSSTHEPWARKFQPAAAAATAAAAAGTPYSSAEEVLDIAEHLSGTQLYMAMLRRSAPGSLPPQHGRHSSHSSTGSTSTGGTSTSAFSTLSSTFTTFSSSSRAASRQLLVLQDELDAFRRGPLREQCAREAARDWRPYKLFNLTDDVTTNPRYSSLLQGGDVVAVISEATANLNRIMAAAPAQQPAAAAAAGAAAGAAQPQPAVQPAAASQTAASSAAAAAMAPAAGAAAGAAAAAAAAAAAPTAPTPVVQQQQG